MWMNLDTLPAGKSMYTVYVTTDEEGTPRSQMCVEEIDVIAPSRSKWGAVVNDGSVHPTGESASAYIIADYGLDSRVVGVVNQSTGTVVYDAFLEGDEG